MPYDLVAINVSRIISSMIDFHLANDFFAEQKASAIYHAFLSGCGWTDVSFDAEMLRRIDASWQINNLN